MKISTKYPPNYEKITSYFGSEIINKSKPAFCYGDTIYNPFGIAITPDLEAHEHIHSKQQEANGGPDRWWDLYFKNSSFRLLQELEAFSAQYHFIKKRFDGRITNQCLDEMSRNLASPTYDLEINHFQAKMLILQYDPRTTRIYPKSIKTI